MRSRRLSIAPLEAQTKMIEAMGLNEETAQQVIQ